MIRNAIPGLKTATGCCNTSWPVKKGPICRQCHDAPEANDRSRPPGLFERDAFPFPPAVAGQ